MQTGFAAGSVAVDTLQGWIPFLDSKTCRYRVFCFPHAGGSAQVYRSWRDFISPWVDFYPVELPGRGLRSHERPVTSLIELIERIARPLEPLLDVPFAFFGHSAGAHAALACARSIRARDGRPAAHLFLSGRGATRPCGAGSSADATDEALIAMLRRLGGTPRAVLEHRGFVSALLPTIRADLALAESPDGGEAEALSCGVTAFGGSDDPSISPASLEAWRHVTNGRFRACWVQGGHFYSPSGVAEIGREMCHDLEADDAA